MTPLQVYVFFVLPAILIVVSGGFVLYGRRQLRARRAKVERDETERRIAMVANLQGHAPHLKIVNT